MIHRGPKKSNVGLNYVIFLFYGDLPNFNGLRVASYIVGVDDCFQTGWCMKHTGPEGHRERFHAAHDGIEGHSGQSGEGPPYRRGLS